MERWCFTSVMVMKVYGGVEFKNSKQHRVIVATKTIKEACRLFEVSYSHFKDYCCETGNEKELKICLKNPDIVFSRELNDYTGEYKPFTEK